MQREPSTSQKLAEDCIVLLRGTETKGDAENLLNQALEQLRRLQVQKGIAFFGATGAGKSTLLNELLGCTLLPTKSSIAGDKDANASSATTSCVLEVVRLRAEENRDLVGKLRLTLKLFDSESWRVHLATTRASIESIDNFVKQGLVCTYALTDEYSELLPALWNKTDDFTLTKECLEQLLDHYPTHDPVGEFLQSRRPDEAIVVTDEDEYVADFLKVLATGRHPLSPMLASVLVEGCFPDASEMPYNVPFFDLPGSGDSVDARIRTREDAKRRSKWAIFVAGQTITSVEFRKDLTEVLELFHNPLIIKSRHWARESFLAFFYGKADSPESEIKQPRKPDQNWSARVERRANPKEALENEILLIKKTIEAEVLQINTKRSRPPFSSPNRVFLTDHVLKKDDSPLTHLNGPSTPSAKNICGACDMFLTQTKEALQRDIKSIVEGPENSFLNALCSISLFAEYIVSTANKPAMPQIEHQDFPLASFQHEVKEAIQALTVESFCDCLSDMYYEMHQPMYHERMRCWGEGSGRCNVGGRYFNTPLSLAQMVSTMLSQHSSILEHTTILRTAFSQQFAENPRWKHTLDTLWDNAKGLFEEALFYSMRAFYLPPLNGFDAYKLAKEKDYKFLDTLLKLLRENFPAIILGLQHTVATLFQPLHRVCQEIITDKIQRHLLENPPALAAINKVYSEAEQKIIRNSLLAAELLLNAGSQRQAVEVKDLQLWPHDKILYLTPNLSYQSSGIAPCLANVPNETKQQAKILVLRFANINDLNLEAIAVQLLNFPSLEAIDLTGNCTLTQEGLEKLHNAHKKLKIVCSFCIAQPPKTDTLHELRWDPPKAAPMHFFTGKKVAFVLASSDYQVSTKLPSSLVDYSTLTEFCKQKGFDTTPRRLVDAASWIEVLRMLNLQEPNFKQEPVAFIFAFFGHGEQQSSVPLLYAENEDACSMSDVYDIIKKYHRDSTFCFLFGCCQVSNQSIQGQPQTHPNTVPCHSLIVRMARLNEVGVVPGTASASPFLLSVLEAFNSTAPMLSSVFSIPHLYYQKSNMTCEVTHTNFPLELRWWN